jgi:hypothetical protein
MTVFFTNFDASLGGLLGWTMVYKRKLCFIHFLALLDVFGSC